jgi:hypothetical protein
MRGIVLSAILIIIGGAITFFSGWLLLHASDRRVLRLLRSPLNPKVSKAYREANAAGRRNNHDYGCVDIGGWGRGAIWLS